MTEKKRAAEKRKRNNMARTYPPPHPICRQMRDLRVAAGMSLVAAGRQFGFSPVALASYERGDRQPPLFKLEDILNKMGYTIVAVPKEYDAIRLTGSIIRELRMIADQLERREHESAPKG